MTDDKKTDPYSGELDDDADLGSSAEKDTAEEEAEKAQEDPIAEAIADTSGMRAEGEAPLP